MNALFELEAVEKRFRVGGRSVHALAGVSLSIAPGSCHALVGESGSGKTTLGNILLGVYPPSGGTVRFKGAALPARRSLPQRRAIQLVQQNPLSALNPRRSVGASLRLPLDVHGIGTPAERRRRVASLLEEVGLDPALARRSPAALSGGQRQRVAIARALACEPEAIVLDEPTSALDVLVQARILALLADLRRRHGLTYVFITHDLAVVRNVADRVSVLRGGRIVEEAGTADLFAAPRDPYTRELIGSVPVVTKEEAQMRDRIAGRTGEDAFAAFHRRADAAVGTRLFTVLTLDRAAGLARRAYTSHPVDYPVSGAKPIQANDWFAQVVDRGETFVANDHAGVAAVFFDHELIRSLGCESAVNLPIADGGTVVGTVNILHQAGWFTPERVAALEALMDEMQPALAAACRNVMGTA
ncbi:MAG: ATP-binding cassette domain-containing protein [Alphaproteobacteria bacterium]